MALSQFDGVLCVTRQNSLARKVLQVPVLAAQVCARSSIVCQEKFSQILISVSFYCTTLHYVTTLLSSLFTFVQTVTRSVYSTAQPAITDLYKPTARPVKQWYSGSVIRDNAF